MSVFLNYTFMLQYSFSMDQLEEVHPNRKGKYKTDIKDKYQFDLLDWLYSEKGMKKINLRNKKLVQLATVEEIREHMGW